MAELRTWLAKYRNVKLIWNIVRHTYTHNTCRCVSFLSLYKVVSARTMSRNSDLTRKRRCFGKKTLRIRINCVRNPHRSLETRWLENWPLRGRSLKELLKHWTHNLILLPMSLSNPVDVRILYHYNFLQKHCGLRLIYYWALYRTQRNVQKSKLSLKQYYWNH